MGTTVKVADVKDLPPGKATCVQIDGQKVAVFNVQGTYYAVGDTCTHRGGPLSGGSVQGAVVTCPWHGARFDLATGKNMSLPAPAAVPCYRVAISGEEIRIEV